MSLIISYDSKDNLITAEIFEKDLNLRNHCKETLKSKGFSWDFNNFRWVSGVNQYSINRELIRKLFLTRENPGVEEGIQRNRPDKELRMIRGSMLNWDMLNYKPFIGKPGPQQNYQEEDILRALKQNRFLFNWETGLGKTYALAALYEFYKTQLHKVKGALIFTSKVGVLNLAEELPCDGEPRPGKPGMMTSVFKKDIVACPSSGHVDLFIRDYNKAHKKEPGFVPVEKRRIFDIPGKNTYIFSYSAWKAIFEVYTLRELKKKLDEIIGETKCVFMDEVHYIGNPKANRTQDILKILPWFDYRYLFTATLADKHEKIYAPAFILDNWLTKGLTFNQWLSCYNDLGTHFSKYAINKHGWHTAELEALDKEMSNYSSKREAEKCLDLPPLYHKPDIWIDMSPNHRALYQYVAECIIKLALGGLKDSDGNNYSFDEAIFARFSTMQSVVDNPAILVKDSLKDNVETLMIPDKCAAFNYARDYEKLHVLEDILEDEVDEKEKRGIIWYTHPLTCEALKENLSKYDPVIITAGDDDATRNAKVREFKTKDKHKVLLASVNILNSSITLSPEATFMVYYENTYSFLNYKQSLGRIHRIGQIEDAVVYHIYYRDCTDVFMNLSIERKETLSSGLLNTLIDDQAKNGSFLMDKKLLKSLFMPKAEEKL